MVHRNFGPGAWSSYSKWVTAVDCVRICACRNTLGWSTDASFFVKDGWSPALPVATACNCVAMSVIADHVVAPEDWSTGRVGPLLRHLCRKIFRPYCLRPLLANVQQCLSLRTNHLVAPDDWSTCLCATCAAALVQEHFQPHCLSLRTTGLCMMIG